MLESMIEDVISLKISDRTLQVENQQLQEESNELRRSIAAMRKAALENALEQEPTRTAVSNLATTKRSPPSKHHSPTQIRHSFNPDQSLLSEMESLERDFEQIGNDLKVFAAESNLTLPDRQQESYKSLNVFERLHRVQTVASQAKVKDHHHPQGSGSLSTRSSKDFLFDDRLFLGASSSSLLSTGLPAIGREIPPLFKPNNDPTQPHHDVMDVGELSATENVEHSADILPSVGQLQPAEFESTAAAAVAISSNDGGMEKLMSIRDAIQRAMFKKNTL
jgi:hypothetical protein